MGVLTRRRESFHNVYAYWIITTYNLNVLVLPIVIQQNRKKLATGGDKK